MKLSDRQAQALFQIAWDSFRITGTIGYSEPQRRGLMNEIVEQQDATVVELGAVELGAKED